MSDKETPITLEDLLHRYESQMHTASEYKAMIEKYVQQQRKELEEELKTLSVLDHDDPEAREIKAKWRVEMENEPINSDE